MKDYTVRNARGRIVRSGSCDDHLFEMQAMKELGETVTEGIEVDPKSEEILHWSEARRRTYPPLVEFADAQHHEAAGNPEPMRLYRAKCQAVKDSIPKFDEAHAKRQMKEHLARRDKQCKPILPVRPAAKESIPKTD
jgi:hypothetical protein